MPVNSNSSQGNNSMYIQPSSETGQSPAGTPPGLSKISTNIAPQNTSDSVKISAGDDFYSIYTDQTLESVLVSRGFSQLRPEVLGSFEFVPPLSSDSIESSQDDGQVVYNSSGAGELIDMQNQLKQLRYAETMYFLRVKCGLLYADHSTDGYPGVFLQTNTLGQTYTFCNSSADVSDSNYTCATPETPLTELYPNDHDATNYSGVAVLGTMWGNSSAVLLESFYDDMAKASSVLEFLAASLSVYELKSAVDIKINNYVDKNSADSSTTAGSIADRLDLYDDDFVSNKAPGNISLESYLKDFMGMPEAYWDNASSTALVMQLVADIVGRTGYPQDTLSGFSPKESNVFGAGEILGVNKNEYSGGYDVLKQLGKIDTSELENYSRKYSYDATIGSAGLYESQHAHVGTPKMDDDSSGSNMFTKGDFFDLWDRLVDQQDPKLFYVVARDFINHCQMKSSKSPATEGSDIEDRLENLIGWNPFEQIKNLAEIHVDSGNMLGIEALRPRKSTFDVATFNKGNGDTPGGGGQIKPGMEYYLSEFLAGGSISDSLEKMTEFSENLDKLTTDLTSFLDAALTPNKGSGSGAPENSLAYGTGASMNPNADDSGGDFTAIPIGQDGKSSPTVPSLSPVGIGSDSGSTSNSAALVQRVFEEFTKTLHTTYLVDMEWSSCNCFGEAGQLLWFAAAANDPACAWAGLKYLLARDNTMKGDDDFPAKETGDLRDIGEDLLALTQDFFQMAPGSSGKLTKYGYGYDDDAFAFEDSDSTYSEQVSGEGNTVTIQLLHPGLELGTDYDGSWFEYWYSGSDLTWTQTDEDGGSTLIPALSDSIGRALEYWEVATADGLGVEGELNQNSVWEGLVTNDLGIGRQGRLVMCYLFALVVMQQTQKFAIWVPGEHASTSYDTWYQTRWSLSKRAIAGLNDANDLKDLPDSSDWGLTGQAYSSKDDESWNYNTGSGYSESIEESINLFWTYYRPQLEYDVLAWNSLYFLTEISDRVREIIDEILSTFSGGLSETSITEQLSDINSAGNLSEIVSASLTRDQVTLSRYLEASISNVSSKYPYLPTLKSVEPNQAMCLGTLCQMNYLVESPMSGKKRIFALGLPSGMVEFLRNSAADEMSNPRYNESNVIKISLWRRNLLNETICETPQEFLFDVSKYVYPDTGASEFFTGQTVDDLLEHTSITKFTKDGPGITTVGQAYEDDVISGFDAEFTAIENLVDVMGNAPIDGSSPTSNALVQVFNNHVLDHYLKLYLRLTTGIDVSEESFCFLEDETIITSPDADKVGTSNEMISLLSSMYNANDLAAGITFQRVSGELTRSIMLSPEKYRNKIIYPKIFDRVFCIVVDDADWIAPQSVEESVDTTESGNLAYENTQKESTSTTVQTDPTYFQYFITVSIMTEVDPEEGEVSSLS